MASYWERVFSLSPSFLLLFIYFFTPATSLPAPPPHPTLKLAVEYELGNIPLQHLKRKGHDQFITSFQNSVDIPLTLAVTGDNVALNCSSSFSGVAEFQKLPEA